VGGAARIGARTVTGGSRSRHFADWQQRLSDSGWDYWLHAADVKRLIGVLQRLVDNGNTVLVIEHNLDIIKVSDWIIDMGPEGGDAGGYVIATGTPEDVAQVDESYTGQFLRHYIGEKV